MMTTILATWFGAGLLPRAPGTWGSLAALPFAWFIVDAAGTWGLLTATVAIVPIGCWAATTYERRSGAHDPGAIVIDEVAGQWLTLLFVAPNPLAYAMGFALFRIFDIVKPWPARWVDQHLTGGLGVMLDDLVAGLYAGALLVLIMIGLGP